MSSSLLPSGLNAHEFRGHMDCLRATKPPYTCPIDNCDRVYKSFSGIQSHLTKFKHESSSSNSKNDDGRYVEVAGSSAVQTETRSEDGQLARGGQQQMSWTQAQKIIDVDVSGKIMRLNILEPITIEFYHGESSKGDEKKPEMVPVPRAVFQEIKEFEPSKMKSFSSSYVRYIEKTADELDEEIEYDMDEDDDAWLELINERRLRVGLPRVSEATFEYVMNRLEKDSYFKTTPGPNSGNDGDGGPNLSGARSPQEEHEDDTVCCVCGDGECDNANAILFCDMCNLAVHQECYGVPYIPEGQWLCRRCQLSPSRGVDCRLCPNKGGAFKQTSDNGWSHVVCALWVPEVQFANTVFLEPIEGFDRIPAARWKLTCYICKQKSKGACIQCHKPSCYTAFHVTCAQQAGLYMKMETVNDAKATDGTGVSVRKSAFCDVHAPTNGGDTASADETGKRYGSESERKSRQSEPPTLTPKFDMRRARKLLSQKRNLSPIVSVPVMPRRKLELLNHQLRFAGKQEFVDRILRYWTLKRRSRFGVPLLRRLQVTHHASRLERERTRNKELQEQYNTWRQLRQDLEKARLLMELVGKRERKKKENVQVIGETWETLLFATQRHLSATIDQLEAIDDRQVFTQPVDDAEVPGYSRIIKSPMDLSTMRTKADRSEYKDFGQLEKDFELMMANCMKFNVQNEYYRSYGLKYKKQGLEILRQASLTYSQLKDNQASVLADMQRQKAQDNSATPTPVTRKANETSVTKSETSATTKTKKGSAPKQKSTSTPKPKPRKSATAGDPVVNTPVSAVLDTPAEKTKSNPKTNPKTPTSNKTPKNEPASTPNVPEATSTTKGQKRKGQKESAKKQPAKKIKKAPTTTATPTPKKTKNKSKPAVGGSKKGKGDRKKNEDDEDKPLAAVIYQTPVGRKAILSPGAASDVFVTPPETAGPSFRLFRQDRKSPNSSAVESEMEPASGDEGDYLRKKAVLASATGAGVDDVNFEHLDFVWVRVDAMRRWMPGVVIDPNIEYDPHSAVRFTPPPNVVDAKSDTNAYLVMLFDEEQSWHWHKRDSLSMLGLDHETDMKRMEETGSAPVVVHAYERALKARSLAMGDETYEDAEDAPPIIDDYRSADESSDIGPSSKRRRLSDAIGGGRTRDDSENSS